MSPEPVPKRPSTAPPNPFKYLDYFIEEDAERFRGRDSAVQAVVNGIIQGRTFVLYGASGTGKTSLMRAGVFPRLRRLGYTPVYVRVVSAPGEDLRTAVFEAYGYKVSPRTGLPSTGGEAPGGRPGSTTIPRRVRFKAADAYEWLARLEELIPEISERPPVMLLDQFEEFFITEQNADGRGAAEALTDHARHEFMGALAHLLKEHRSAHVVFSLRQDYLAGLDDYRRVFSDLYEHEYRLKPLSAFGARQAIAGQLSGTGVDYSPRFLIDVVNYLEPVRYDPTILQIVCTEVYEMARERGERPLVLTAEDLEKVGDLRRIFRARLDRFELRLPPELDLTGRAVLEALVTSAGTKRAVTVEHLATSGLMAEERELESVLSALIDQRLVRRVPRRPEDLYELVHDRLAPIVADWLDADETFFRFRAARDLIDNSLLGRAWELDSENLLTSGQIDSVIRPFAERLALDEDELRFVLRSAIYRQRGDAVRYWSGRVGQEQTADLITELLAHDEKQLQRAAIVASRWSQGRKHAREIPLARRLWAGLVSGRRISKENSSEFRRGTLVGAGSGAIGAVLWGVIGVFWWVLIGWGQGVRFTEVWSGELFVVLLAFAAILTLVGGVFGALTGRAATRRRILGLPATVWPIVSRMWQLPAIAVLIGFGFGFEFVLFEPLLGSALWLGSALAFYVIPLLAAATLKLFGDLPSHSAQVARQLSLTKAGLISGVSTRHRLASWGSALLVAAGLPLAIPIIAAILIGHPVWWWPALALSGIVSLLTVVFAVSLNELDRINQAPTSLAATTPDASVAGGSRWALARVLAAAVAAPVIYLAYVGFDTVPIDALRRAVPIDVTSRRVSGDVRVFDADYHRLDLAGDGALAALRIRRGQGDQGRLDGTSFWSWDPPDQQFVLAPGEHWLVLNGNDGRAEDYDLEIESVPLVSLDPVELSAEWQLTPVFLTPLTSDSAAARSQADGVDPSTPRSGSIQGTLIDPTGDDLVEVLIFRNNSAPWAESTVSGSLRQVERPEQDALQTYFTAGPARLQYPAVNTGTDRGTLYARVDGVGSWKLGIEYVLNDTRLIVPDTIWLLAGVRRVSARLWEVRNILEGPIEEIERQLPFLRRLAGESGNALVNMEVCRGGTRLGFTQAVVEACREALELDPEIATPAEREAIRAIEPVVQMQYSRSLRSLESAVDPVVQATGAARSDSLSAYIRAQIDSGFEAGRLPDGDSITTGVWTGQPLRFYGNLTEADSSVLGKYRDTFQIDVPSAASLTVTLYSQAFDPTLEVDGPSAENRFNDDWLRRLDTARLELSPAAPGVWTIKASSYSQGETGPYLIEVTGN